MIDEKVLIEVMLKSREREHGTVASLIDWFIEVINKCPKVCEWIPCSERLPSEDCYCLITTSDSEIDVREYNYSKGWRWDGFERVIAWQPLPLAYKGE